MAGAILAARSQGVPVLLDGFGAALAAGVLAAADPGAILNVMAADLAEEPAHAALLERLGLEPVLDLGLTVGEGASGAAAAAILRLACELA
jgi:nicotinate-nucleotide--dimethylbenzimidazole phosphoribosyltransferase